MAHLDCVTATYRIVTPLFLGDAERQATRLSVASFKGALRWWWRAAEWPRCLAKAGGEAAALARLHERERRLFGTAGTDPEKGLGQSRVLLRLVGEPEIGRPLPRETELRGADGQPVGPGARYLGYGLMGAFGARQGRLDRSAFPGGGTFTVELRLRRDVEDEERRALVRAVRLMGLLGGLGARARSGWGSLSLVGLEGDPAWQTPGSVQAYGNLLIATLRELLPLTTALPPFTAFSALSRIEIVAAGDDGLHVLDQVGRQMQRYRAWGFQGKVNGQESERNFKADHDWAKEPWIGEGRRFVPRRAAMGLPHNYGPKCRNAGVTLPKGAGGDRRASPLLLHVHALGGRSHVAVLTLLPARFAPGDRLQVRWDGGGYEAPVPAGWESVLHGFFDGPPQANERRLPPYFPRRTPVLRPATGGRP